MSIKTVSVNTVPTEIYRNNLVKGDYAAIDTEYKVNENSSRKPIHYLQLPLLTVLAISR